MATAPGQSARGDIVCYNCGSTSHWMIACPEPTRNKPAGLERWKSQHQERSSERDGHEKKGPIVTRYPPPPGQVPRYPAPYPSGPPPPPPPPAAQGYPQPGFSPPPPYAGAYPPPPPPQYAPYPSAPPPGPVPPPFGQPYAQPPYLGSFPPAYYPGNVPPPPPPPPQAAFPGPYPNQHYGAPPPPHPIAPGVFPPYPGGAPPPPPAGYQFPAPAVPASRPPPPPPPPPGGSGYGAPLPPPPGVDRPPGLPPRPPAPLSQTPSGQHRNRNQRHQGSRRNNGHRDRRDRPGHEGPGRGGNGRNERHSDRQAAPESKQGGRHAGKQGSKQASKQSSQQTPKDKGHKSSSDKRSTDDGDPEWDPGSEQDMKRVFPEIKVKEADPVGIPLPAEFTDEPTIPPAYNATCIKSEYITEDVAAFVTPIRATARWSEARWDPVFKHYPGMIKRRFDGIDLDYASYDAPLPLSPSTEIKMPPRYKIDLAALAAATPDNNPTEDSEVNARGGGLFSGQPSRERHYRDTSSSRYDKDGRADRRFVKRQREESFEEVEFGGRDMKRLRGSDSRRDTPGNGGSRPRSPAFGSSPTMRYSVEKDSWSPPAGGNHARTSSDGRFLDVQPDNRSSSSREGRVSLAKARHDSGYHSGQSLDRTRASRRQGDRGRRKSDRSAPRSPSASRSRSHSRTSSANGSRGRGESPLTALEAELLGMAEEDEAPAEPPVQRAPAAKAKKKAPIRRKVAAVYDRRW